MNDSAANRARFTGGSEAAQNWSNQVTQALNQIDDDALKILLGDVEPAAARKIFENVRLHSPLAHMAELAGFALPVPQIPATNDQRTDKKPGFGHGQIMAAALAVASHGLMIGREQRRALIAEFGEPLIQELWTKCGALLARLAQVDFEPVLTADFQTRTQILSDYNAARGLGPNTAVFRFKTNTLPLAQLDEAYDCLARSGMGAARGTGEFTV